MSNGNPTARKGPSGASDGALRTYKLASKFSFRRRGERTLRIGYRALRDPLCCSTTFFAVHPFANEVRARDEPEPAAFSVD